MTSRFSKIKPSKWSSRQAASTILDRSQSPGIDPSKTLSRSSTKLIATGSSESKGGSCASNGQTSPLRDPPPQTQPRTINVVLFGETGVGKSSVINLIARKEIAEVSSDVNGCTMQYKRYDIPFDTMDFAIFDTIGLEEPQMGVNGYLKAIEKAYELISRLGTAGGIHLLLFCMRGGRITATTQSNYRLFCECLCNTKVPIALVFTGLEREVEMEDWWRRNKKHIEDYGIKSDGHACITAVQDDIPGEDHKYKESQKRIRELLKNCARKHDPFSPESHPWFARFTKGMMGFVTGKKSPKKKDIMKVLTNRCKLDAETARKIAAMMENGDTETNKNKDPQAGNGKGENEKVIDPAKNPTNDDSTPSESSNVEGASDVVWNKGGEVRNKMVEDAPPSESNNVKAAPDVVRNKGEEVRNKVAKDAPPSESNNVKAASDVVRNKGEEVRNKVVEDALPSESNNVKAAPDVVRNKGEEVRNKVTVAGDAPSKPNKFKVAPGGGQPAEGGSDGDQVAEQTMPGGFTPAVTGR